MDYEKIGLRVGLEIHQQIASGTKLFCRCPVSAETLKIGEYPITATRKLRPVSGELGKIDPAAVYEFLRNRSFVYTMHPDTSCLVEIDDDPPNRMNRKALEIAIQACNLLGCKIADEIHVMRKTVIDGSAVSGFQRTSLIGLNGCIETKHGKVGIQTVCIEEDSSPAIFKENGVIHYRLDRLGIPLIEIATDSSIHSPEQARDVAEHIGLMLRSLPVVRGIGSIRQDVNVSIEKGSRIEIKGFQELDKIPELVKNEVERQFSLLEIKDELHKRGVKEIKSQPHDITDLFKNTKNNFLRKIIQQGGSIYGFALPQFSGIMKEQCGDRTFGRELSSYAEAYGYGIIHSEEDLNKYELKSDFEQLRKKLGAEERDVAVVCAGKAPQKACGALIERAAECLNGVPEETRVADGIGSKYTRPLPGSERLYPESDVPPARITKEYLDSIKTPKTLLERAKELEKKMPHELVNQIIHSKHYNLFEEYSSKYEKDLVLIANTLLSTIKQLKRDGYDTSKIRKEHLDKIFMAVEKNAISKQSVDEMLKGVTEGRAVEKLISQYETMKDDEIKAIIKEAIKKNPTMNESAIMGIVMGRVKGRADGKRVMQMLKDEIRK